jgi:regulator of protease activity HflC (stomatin/prohibitin superfamily)
MIPCPICVDQGNRAVIQRCGEYSHIAAPGLSCIFWPWSTATMVSIKVRQIDVRTDTKSKDNVTLKVTTAVQYSVDPEKVNDYFFKLNDPERQITAHVEDCVRSFLPTLDLDHAFESKEKMATEIKDSVAKSMAAYGIQVAKCLVVDMQPDASVMASMNQINAARRQREAAIERAEADKIMAVRAAEADAEAKHLSGMGTAKMRQAITEGFRGSIESMKESCGLEPKEVIHMMMVTQYLDVLKEFAASGKATMVVPHGPSAVSDIESQVRHGFMQAAMVNEQK